MRPFAVVLLSGGLDSATVLALAVEKGFAAIALSVRYGQRHAIELEAARRVAAAGRAAEHRVVEVDLRALGGSALTADIAVPKDRDLSAPGEIPVTYVPARNTIFLALALGLAEARGAEAIFIGANAVDYSGYPDCRPEFIAAFERLACVGTRAGVSGRPIRIHAPLIDMSKEEIIRCGLDLGVDYGLTSSCYDPTAAGLACGHCDSCRLRLAAFSRLGLRDPAQYA